MRRPLVVGNWKMHGDGAWLDRVDAIATVAVATPAVSVTSLPPGVADSVVVAYEPVWAIGRGRRPSTKEIVPVVLALHRDLAERGVTTAPVLYGGSVDAAAAAALMREGGIDGLLVGSASLDPAAFAAIIAAAA